MTYLMLLSHSNLVRDVTDTDCWTKIRQHSQSCFRDFQTSIFNRVLEIDCKAVASALKKIKKKKKISSQREKYIYASFLWFPFNSQIAAKVMS